MNTQSVSALQFFVSAFFVSFIFLLTFHTTYAAASSTGNDLLVETDQTLIADEYTYDSVVVKSGVTLTLASSPTATGTYKGVVIQANSITVEAGGFISANGYGYTRQQGPGAPADYRAGGSYGGAGSGNHMSSTYGNAMHPVELGSGGGNDSGGGAIRLIVSNSLVVDGEISADGNVTGSGGSINITTGALEGAGTISAQGGQYRITAKLIQPGGGGRVFINYETNNFTGDITTRGGLRTQGRGYAQTGSVGLYNRTIDVLAPVNRFDFNGSFGPFVIDSLVINDSDVELDEGVGLSVRSVELHGASTLQVSATSSLEADFLTVNDTSQVFYGGVNPLQVKNIVLTDTAVLTGGSLMRMQVEAENLTIGADARVYTDELGYSNGQGPGAPANGSRVGGSHGGLGRGATSSVLYGSAEEPVDFGSPGDFSGHGGGALSLVISEHLENNGTISAKGGLSASGGSVLITAKKLSGSGTIVGDGGRFGVSARTIGGGGGGRVAVYYENDTSWTGTTTANGGRNASSAGSPITYAGDGTVVFEQELTGASSVLFLPGIQASRLYTDGAFGTENQLWEPNRNADVQKLEMTETGDSVNSIYTRDIMDSVLGIQIYENFLVYLQTQKSENSISDWKTFAYDWRYDVFDVVKNGTQYEAEIVNPIDVLIKLSADTNSKVTIVAHSNGGLLAKALMIALEEQGKDRLVERVIFLASPQAGTPKAVGTILHGYDQEKVGGFLIDDEVAREVIKNMSGVYGLVPATSYFSQTSAPIIVFEETPATDIWRNDWGSEINTIEELSAFIRDERGGRLTPEDIYQPSVANDTFITEAIDYHKNKLDIWEAPEGVEVFEVVGTGLETIDYFTYKTFQRKECSFGFVNCEVIDYLKPVPHFTQYGDETVLAVSADAYQFFKKTYYVDLGRIKLEDEINSVTHADIGESLYVQQLVSNIIADGFEEIPFVSEAITPYNTARDVIGGHSPISLRVEDNEGNIVEKREGALAPEIITEIPGSRYIEFAGGKYIIIPSDVDYTVTIEGESEGSYSLQIERIEGSSNSVLLSEYSLATTTSEMKATFQKIDGVFSTVTTDLDGDGKIDIETTLNGVVIEEVTYESLYETIEELKLSFFREKFLLRTASLAEKFKNKAEEDNKFKKQEKRILNKLKKLVQLYKQWRVITKEEKDTLIEMIIELKNK